MSTFQGQIDRALAQQYGEEAVRIIEQGGYRAPSGQRVELAAAIEEARRGTVAYPPEAPYGAPRPGVYETRIEVKNETTLAAVQRLLAEGCNPAALNFASATHPGGGFLNGARAQEEYLARSSGLYACLKGQAMYAYHHQQRDALYSSYMLYSPAVPVFRDDDGSLLETPYTASMITAAAPNANYLHQSRRGEIETAFRERIAKLLWIGLEQGHDALVLGAWGCGAFGNDGRMVARVFREALEQGFKGAYRRVAFAILDWSSERRYIGPFAEAFGG